MLMCAVMNVAARAWSGGQRGRSCQTQEEIISYYHHLSRSAGENGSAAQFKEQIVPVDFCGSEVLSRLIFLQPASRKKNKKMTSFSSVVYLFYQERNRNSSEKLNKSNVTREDDFAVCSVYSIALGSPDLQFSRSSRHLKKKKYCLGAQSSIHFEVNGHALVCETLT